jgi:uncharacterized damage-inducible protein DinB
MANKNIPFNCYDTPETTPGGIMANSAQEYVQRFMMHRGALVDLLEIVPENQGEFKAWENGMSFIALVDHLSSSGTNLVNLAQGKERVKLEPSPSLPAATTRLKDSTAQIQTVINQMTPEQLAQKTTAFRGMEMPVYALIDFMREHEVHHKGQLWMMARMIGIEPPSLIKFG